MKVGTNLLIGTAALLSSELEYSRSSNPGFFSQCDAEVPIENLGKHGSCSCNTEQVHLYSSLSSIVSEARCGGGKAVSAFSPLHSLLIGGHLVMSKGLPLNSLPSATPNLGKLTPLLYDDAL
jgi:hypothetical protein